jgi:hypothetical protein
MLDAGERAVLMDVVSKMDAGEGADLMDDVSELGGLRRAFLWWPTMAACDLISACCAASSFRERVAGEVWTKKSFTIVAVGGRI